MATDSHVHTVGQSPPKRAIGGNIIREVLEVEEKSSGHDNPPDRRQTRAAGKPTELGLLAACAKSDKGGQAQL
jgi:hypothetical protein